MDIKLSRAARPAEDNGIIFKRVRALRRWVGRAGRVGVVGRAGRVGRALLAVNV